MKAPFTSEQFLSVFQQYNSGEFPAQILFFGLALGICIVLFSKYANRNRLIAIFLGLTWIWMGAVYHFLFFTGINKAAYVFGSLFIIQGLLFLINTLYRNRLIFQFRRDLQGYLGAFFILFGILLYPMTGLFLNHDLSRLISIGLPCPTTIMTFGLLMLTNRKAPGYLYIIPGLWSLIGISAAVNFHVYQDYMLLIAAVIATAYYLKDRRNKHVHLNSID